MKRLQALLFIICACAIGGFAQERYSWKRLAGNATASLAINAAVTYSLKPLVGAVRPDGSDNRSFPSGHTSFAFTGATVLYKETRDISPWIGFAGYAAATGVAMSV